MPGSSGRVRIILDIDLAEIYAGNGSTSLRIPIHTDPAVVVAGNAEHLSVHCLSCDGA